MKLGSHGGEGRELREGGVGEAPKEDTWSSNDRETLS
jgi:hypothetical protein